jgi:hypothetical protein
LNGIQSLRGALVAQSEINASLGRKQMQQRLLIANPGDAFAYGSPTGPGPNVAKMIADRTGPDRAGVR